MRHWAGQGRSDFSLQTTGELVNNFVVPCPSSFSIPGTIDLEIVDSTLTYYSDYQGELILGDLLIESTPFLPENLYVTQFNADLHPQWVLDSDNHQDGEWGKQLGIEADDNLVYLLGTFYDTFHLENYTLTDQAGDSDYFLATISIPTDIPERTTTNGFRISPNPTSSILTIHNSPATNLTSFQILDTSGRTCLNNELIGNQVDVTSLEPGLYTILLTSNKNQFSAKKFIRQ